MNPPSEKLTKKQLIGIALMAISSAGAVALTIYTIVKLRKTKASPGPSGGGVPIPVEVIPPLADVIPPITPVSHFPSGNTGT